MDAVDVPTRVLAAIERSLCRDPDTEFVVVFGSHVTGAARSSSDLDVAVKFAAGLSVHERFQKRCFLSGDVQQDGIPFVDVSDIEDLPLPVAHDAVNGEFLCGDEQAFRQFKTSVKYLGGKPRGFAV